MSSQSLEKIWQSLLTADKFLQTEINDKISHGGYVDPNEWTVLHNAAQVIEEECFSVPKNVYQLGKNAIYSLVDDINFLMNMFRTLGKPGDKVVGEDLAKINLQLKKMKENYRNNLHDLKTELDDISQKEQQPIANLPPNLSIGGDFIISGDKVGRDKIGGNRIGDKDIDLVILAKELSRLRKKLKAEATKPEHDISIGVIASAEKEAKQGNEQKAKEYLSQAGKWALDTATKIGSSIAAEAIKNSLGIK